MFTVDKQLGGAKKIIINWVRSLSTFVHKGHPTMIVYHTPFQLIAGSLSTVKDGDQTDVSLQHKFLLD